MQDERGMMNPIDREEFNRMIADDFPSLNNQTKHQRVLQVGDVFKVRNCTFEVSEIKIDGIFAKGISYGEWLKRRIRNEIGN